MRQYLIPGHGFLFRRGGLSLEEMAAECHAAGILDEEEFAHDGGVPALRRHIYALTCQGLDVSRPASARKQGPRERALDKLTREANEYAHAARVCDAKFIGGTITMEALEAFGIPLTGKNLIDAELLLTLRKLGCSTSSSGPLASSNPTTSAIVRLVDWIYANGMNPPF